MLDAIERCLALSRRASTEQGEALAHTLATLQATLAEAHALMTPSVDADDRAVLELDLTGYVTAWSPGAGRMFGYTADEVLGRHVLFLYTPDNLGDEDGSIVELASELDGKVGVRADVRRRRKDGAVIWVRLHIFLRHDAGGEPSGMLVQLTAIDQALSASDKVNLHARIIEDSDQGVLITDANERIVSVNSSFTRITGYSQEESIGQTPDLLRSGVHSPEFRAKVRAAMRGAGPWRGEIVGKRKNGELFPQSVTISAVRDANGDVSHTFSLFSDISEHKDAEARMQRMANYDPLTGLPNLCLLTQLVGQALMETRRTKAHGAMLVVEITRVGAISDTLGADIGNALLCEIGRLFRQALREADVLARLDGHKFAVALFKIEKREHAGVVAQKLLAALASPIQVASHSLQVGGHIGITVYNDDAHDVPTLIRYADVAMGRAAQNIESGFLFYSEEMNLRAKEHLRIESELRQAIANDELCLYYQPKVSLRSGRIVGAEALLRWRHPERGLMAPGVFIPVAEESGLILDLGSWVLEQACRQIGVWREAGLDAIVPPIAINLSARQFDAGLPGRVAAVLERHGVQPEQLNLEITESLLVRGTEQVVDIMNRLVAMGMSLALDDFGTGYSSLAYLKKFPISTLKIDRSFVIGLPYEENDCAIARAIVTMAQQLRQEIVAEGVETPEQMRFLRELGCDQLQGYLFSPPVPAADFAAMLGEGRRLAFAS
ncbi:diguanylate cyclase [Duganella sp. Leaf126]|uniref:putative bifunctional diguanylate cyclase/phosphodiesterase n=1 Tax=Duganella sp. Leaf126 TaxID=1736266 RepID=UPI0006FFD4DB|nr:EAL domain-containing protein [Duganella sp. Leaf126]KQQ39928.1 diguanylate cyclase [Duganella sp. Leaf126]